MTVTIRIATRRSRLALVQSQWVGRALCVAHPDLKVTYVPIVTEGDQRLAGSLASIGGKGLFTKALEQAIFEDRADIAVHSMKDMPVSLPDGLCIGAVPERIDARDVLVSSAATAIENLPKAARIGTASARRQLQMLRVRPDLKIMMLRGNVDTRIVQLTDGKFDALVLAAAGLKRLQLECATTSLDPAVHIPAPGQGALAIECLSNAHAILSLLKPLHHAPSATCVMAERACTTLLGGGCHTPMGAYATLHEDRLILRACLGTPDAQNYVEVCELGASLDPIAVGQSAAVALLAQGGQAIMEILASAYT